MARNKNENFQARFDAQTDFALGLLVSQKKQKKTTVVEEAILELARAVAEKAELAEALRVAMAEYLRTRSTAALDRLNQIEDVVIRRVADLKRLRQPTVDELER